MNCKLFIVILTCLYNVYALSIQWCGFFGTCKADPHKGSNYYIGRTDEDCRNILTCSTRKDVPIQNCGNNGGHGACVIEWTDAFSDCYDRDGNAYGSWLNYKVKGYDNPFKTCQGNNKKYIVNANDNKCYYGSKGSKVTSRNVGKREMNIPSALVRNNRCLVGMGWCPCHKK